MVKLGSLLRRSSRDKEEQPAEEPKKKARKPSGPPLMLLAPDVAGVSSFRMHRFDDSEAAKAFLLSYPPSRQVGGIHAFWALQDEPGDEDAQPEQGDEAMVLIRTKDGSDVVYVVSFVDIASAQSFARFEVKRGLGVGLVMIYWAVLVNITETEGEVAFVPAVPPRISANGHATAAPKRTRSNAVEEQRRRQADEKRRLQAELEEIKARQAETEELRKRQVAADFKKKQEVQAEKKRRQAEAEETRRLHAEAEEITALKAEAEKLRNSEAEAEECERREAKERKVKAQEEKRARLAVEVQEAAVLSAQPEPEPAAQLHFAAGEPIIVAQQPIEDLDDISPQSRPEETGSWPPPLPAPDAGGDQGLSDVSDVLLAAPEPVGRSAGEQAAPEELDDELATDGDVVPVATLDYAEHEPDEAFQATPVETLDVVLDDMPETQTASDTKAEELFETFEDDEADAPVEIPAEFAALPEVQAEQPDESGAEAEPGVEVNSEVAKLLGGRRWAKRDSPFDGFKSPPGRF